MKLVSWNVNGIRGAWNHGLSAFMDSCNADIYCFQETKINEPFLPAVPEDYYAYWSFCERKSGYSGTVCFSRWKPLHYKYGFDDKLFDSEGRIITLEFPDFYLVNCYVPNSQRSASRHDYREQWDALLLVYLRELKLKKPTIVCGDFNVPISDADIYAENKWVEINAEGFQSTERENLLQIVDSGFIDSYRLIHPEETGKYTWWSNRRFKRKENRGWRLDYFLISANLRENVIESCMSTNVMGSDHCPIVLDINLPEQNSPQESTDRRASRAFSFSDVLKMRRYHSSFDYVKRTDMTATWNSIDWKSCEERLQTMQMALAKSAYTHDWNLIAKWQKSIVYSLEAKVLAVRHVCSTDGGSGVDCIKWSSAHEKMSAALSLDSKGYHAMPARLLLVRSKKGKQRRIHIETYYDRAMQTLYAYALDPVAESWGDRKSYSSAIQSHSFF